MGFNNGLTVHYRRSGGTECEPLIVTADGAPAYNNVVSGVLLVPGANDGDAAELLTQVNVDRDDRVLDANGNVVASLVDDRWHYVNECPDMFDPDNTDAGPPAPVSPFAITE